MNWVYNYAIQRHIYEKMKEEEANRMNSINGAALKLPEQQEKQLPKIFMRATSACKVRFDESMSFEYRETKQKTESNPLTKENMEFKVKPFVHQNQRRPSSRAKFDESCPLIAVDHFVCWCNYDKCDVVTLTCHGIWDRTH